MVIPAMVKKALNLWAPSDANAIRIISFNSIKK
jgi:hypothetical protein